MAQKIQTLFIDDLDGSTAEGTVRFGLDGTEYEIDLSADHAQALRDALARYVGCCPTGRSRCPAASPEWSQGIGERTELHRGARVGEDPRHGRKGPRPGAR